MTPFQTSVRQGPSRFEVQLSDCKVEAAMGFDRLSAYPFGRNSQQHGPNSLPLVSLVRYLVTRGSVSILISCSSFVHIHFPRGCG